MSEPQSDIPKLPLAAQIEALLFWKNEPMQAQALATLLSVQADEITTAATELAEQLAGRGVRLITSAEGYSLATAPAMAHLIEACVTEELSKDLGKAGLETLAIIGYRHKATRADIDYIRGVNSSFVLRNLQIRGLISREPDPKDERRFSYSLTTEALRFLGAESAAHLPDYAALSQELQAASEQSA